MCGQESLTNIPADSDVPEVWQAPHQTIVLQPCEHPIRKTNPQPKKISGDCILHTFSRNSQTLWSLSTDSSLPSVSGLQFNNFLFDTKQISMSKIGHWLCPALFCWGEPLTTSCLYLNLKMKCFFLIKFTQVLWGWNCFKSFRGKVPYKCK